MGKLMRDRRIVPEVGPRRRIRQDFAVPLQSNARRTFSRKLATFARSFERRRRASRGCQWYFIRHRPSIGQRGINVEYNGRYLDVLI